MPNRSSALIIGAAGVIGQTIARHLSAKGHRLGLVDRNVSELETLSNQLEDASSFFADATDARAMAKIFESVGHDLVNVVLAAGHEGPIGLLEDCSDDDFRNVMEHNVSCVWVGLKLALKTLKPKKKGSIVVLSSISGIMGTPMMSAYTASKHAVLGLVRSAARESAASGVRINAVCPGPVVSDMMQRIDQLHSRDNVSNSIPMQRYAKPEEVARMVAFLCSEDSGYSTGSCFMVDGGYSCR